MHMNKTQELTLFHVLDRKQINDSIAEEFTA